MDKKKRGPAEAGPGIFLTTRKSGSLSDGIRLVDGLPVAAGRYPVIVAPECSPPVGEVHDHRRRRLPMTRAASAV